MSLGSFCSTYILRFEYSLRYDTIRYDTVYVDSFVSLHCAFITMVITILITMVIKVSVTVTVTAAYKLVCRAQPLECE